MNVFRLFAIIIRSRPDFNRYSIIKHCFAENFIIHLMPPGVITTLRHPDTETRCILPTSRHAKKTEQDCYPLRISHHSNHSHFFRISFYDPNGRLRTKIRNKTVSMLSITQLFSSLPSKEMQNSSQYSTGNY